MELTPAPLRWQPAPEEELARLGSEGWPLLDYLLTEPGTSLLPSEAAEPDRTSVHEAQRAALRALIDAAFGS